MPCKISMSIRWSICRTLSGKMALRFLIVYFKEAGAYYYVPFRDVKRFWDRAAEGGRKSFLRHELDQDYQIRTSNQIFIHYLDALSRDLESRPES